MTDVTLPCHDRAVQPVLCLAGTLYGNVDFVDERHRHRYEVCISCYTIVIMVLL